MIILWLLLPYPLVGSHLQLYSGVEADIVMESIKRTAAGGPDGL